MQQIFRPNENIKIIRSTSQNKVIYDHELKVEQIETKLKLIFNDEYKDLNFFISGSYILNTLFYVDKESNDIDIYPRDDESKNKIIELLIKNNQGQIFESDIAFSGEIQNTKIQIVKEVFEDAKKLFANFDIDICCFAYTNQEFHLNKNGCISIAQKTLNLNFKELKLENIEENILIKRISILFERIDKYAKRYKLPLNNNVFDILKELSLKIDDKVFTPDTGIKYDITDSSGAVIETSIVQCLWLKLYHHLQNNNIHYHYFVEYLKRFNISLK